MGIINCLFRHYVHDLPDSVHARYIFGNAAHIISSFVCTKNRSCDIQRREITTAPQFVGLHFVLAHPKRMSDLFGGDQRWLVVGGFAEVIKTSACYPAVMAPSCESDEM